MKLKLSKQEVLALKLLCAGSLSAGGLASALGAKKPFATRLLRSLEEKSLVSVERKGTEKRVSLAEFSAAGSAFKKLAESRPKARIEEWLSGSALDALAILASRESVSMEFLKRESDCSLPTLYKTLRALSSAGVVLADGGRARVTDGLVRAFADSFADALQNNALHGSGGYTVLVRAGKNVVFRTDSTAFESKQGFQLTGMSKLAPALKVIPTGYRDYYFRLGKRVEKLASEDFFVHALLLSTLPQHAPDKAILALYFKQEGRKFDKAELKTLAKTFAVEGELEALKTAVGYYEKIKDYER